MKKPSKNHPWKLGLSGPVSYGSRRGSTRGYYRPPEESSPESQPSEIEELGLDLVVPKRDHGSSKDVNNSTPIEEIQKNFSTERKVG